MGWTWWAEPETPWSAADSSDSPPVTEQKPVRALCDLHDANIPELHKHSAGLRSGCCDNRTLCSIAGIFIFDVFLLLTTDLVGVGVLFGPEPAPSARSRDTLHGNSQPSSHRNDEVIEDSKSTSRASNI